jgi:Ser-tRNA(Ala) deacylase AlaX
MSFIDCPKKIIFQNVEHRMKKVFWDDPYQTKLETVVEQVEGNQILLRETIAFSFSGGQESDKAWINGLPVLDFRKEGTLIFYTLSDDHGLQSGDKIILEIDWPRRYKLMRLHFAAELVLELVTRKLSVEKIGAHIAEDKARIDFLSTQNIASLFPDILTDYDAIIEKDAPIKTDFSDIENQRRYWEIEHFSKVPCGGTHVKSTAEVGKITLKRHNVGKGKERIEIRLVNP